VRKTIHRSLRRALAITVVLAVGVLLGAEAGARVLSPYVPTPHLWSDGAVETKVAQMDARAGMCTDVILAGNSMGRDAFIPHIFGAADPLHRSAYNASLDAASPPMLTRWLTEEVLPRTSPATVLLTLASPDVNVNSKAGQAVREAYDEAPLSRPGLGGRAEAAATRASALIRHRSELRRPSLVWEALDRARRDDHVPPDVTDVIGPDGEGLSRRSLHYRQNPVSRAFVTGQLLNDFSFGTDGAAPMFDSERALIQTLKDRGISVALIVLPVTDDFVKLHPGGPAQFQEFLDTASQLATDTGVPFLDLHDAPDAGGFADTHHLNSEGSERFSSGLSDRLSRAGLTSRHCDG